MAARLEFDVSFGPAGRRREETAPMWQLLLGDFSHTAVSERPPLASRPTHRVDVESLDDVIGRLRPKLALPAPITDIFVFAMKAAPQWNGS